jgi:hypothetical protein
MATSFTHFSAVIALHIYANRYMSSVHKSKAWFSPFKSEEKADCFNKRGLVDYFKNGIPSTGMFCMESWAFQLTTMLAAFISIKATSV